MIKIRLIGKISLCLLAVAVLPLVYWRKENSDSQKNIPTLEGRKSNEAQQERLVSYYNDELLYREILKDDSSLVKVDNVAAGIISHHFLAKSFIADFFAGIDFAKIKRVLIVSPDHYGAIKGSDYLIATSDLPWETPWGNVLADREYIKKMEVVPEIRNNDKIFRAEHGIYTLVPFIKKVAPDVEVIPLAVDNVDNFSKFNELGRKLGSLKDDNTLLVVSSDFSHGVDLRQAIAQDALSVKMLEAQRIADLQKITCDCRNCMALLLGYLDNKKHLAAGVAQANAADFGSDKNSADLTSYVRMYFLK